MSDTSTLFDLYGVGNCTVTFNCGAQLQATSFLPEMDTYSPSVVKPDMELQVTCLLQVSMAEFMTDEDLEALKTDVHAETPNAGQDTHIQVG